MIIYLRNNMATFAGAITYRGLMVKWQFFSAGTGAPPAPTGQARVIFLSGEIA